MRRKTLKRTILRNLNGANVIIALIAIITSYLLTTTCNAYQDLKTQPSQAKEIIHDVKRVADAFEWYNERRF